MVEVGRRLVALRKALDLKAKDMCGQVNVEANTWSQWEKGKRLAPVDAMMRVADVYGADLNYIYMGSTSSMPHELAVKVREQLAKSAPPPDDEIIAMLERRGLTHVAIEARRSSDESEDSDKKTTP